MRQTWLRPDRGPHGEREERDRDHRRDEVAGHDVYEALDRRPTALRLRDHLHDLGEHGLGSDPLRKDDERPTSVDRGSGHPVALALRDGQRLPCEHGLVDAAAPFDHAAVRRNPFARAYAEAIPYADLLERHVAFRAVGGEQASRLRREPEQDTDRRPRSMSRPELQHLTEQDQRGDHGGGLEVDGDLSARPAERFGEAPWQQRADQAVEVGRARSQGDQREHVEVARAQRGPAAHEEGPAAPEHDGSGESELSPEQHSRRERTRERLPREHLGHGDPEYGRGQREAHPEAARHVVELWIGLFVGEARAHRLERHAAHGTGPGTLLPDLGVHRTGVLGGRVGARSSRTLSQVALRVLAELLQAAVAAEAIAPAAVLVSPRAESDPHPADGILLACQALHGSELYTRAALPSSSESGR